MKKPAIWTTLVLPFISSVQAATSCSYPTRELAGVTVVDTPLVRAAEAFAKKHNEHAAFKHVMRSWLYGVLMIQANETLSSSIDLELHSVATILHDLGWDRAENSTLVSPDKRFEVDGAIAARGFVTGHEGGTEWDERRLQLLWDSIALHTQPSIALYKELDVRVVLESISMDAFGPMYGVSEEDYALVGEVFPKDDLFVMGNETTIWLCRTKPETTYGELSIYLRRPNSRY